jgi:integrase
MQATDMRKIMASYAGRPGVGRNVLSAIRVMLADLVADGMADPTAGIKRPKLSKDGWHCWTEAEIEAFERKHPIGSTARLAFALALYTAQRAGDLVVMGRQHIRNGKVSVRQQKTGARLWIPLHPKLKAILDATPMSKDHLHLILNEKGKPYADATTLSHAMGRWTAAAGLKGVPLHGLRKAACRRLAEAGCTPFEIMAISGHVTLSEVERYTRAAARDQMAVTAMAKLS